MDINQIIANSTSGAPKPAPSPAALGQDQFLTILIAQLKNQDPLNPQDPGQFTAQLAQFSSLEQQLTQTRALKDLAAVQTSSQVIASAGLIGRKVLAQTQHFDVDASGQLPSLQFELKQPTEIVGIDVLDGSGRVVARAPGLGTLGAGIHSVDPSRLDKPLAPGSYSFRVNPVLGSEAQVSHLVEALVTGTALDQSEPVLLMGSAVAKLSDVREVRQ